MATALECDVCGGLYKKYEVQPVNRNHDILEHKRTPRSVVFKGNPQSCLAAWGGREHDLCPGCLRGVVLEYLKAIPENNHVLDK